MKSDLIEKSKFISYNLRHNPEVVDKKGWCPIEYLLNTYHKSIFTFEELKDIVENNDKKRFELSEDEKQIRAVQGHTVKVDVELEKKIPPATLYHGTKKEFLPAIKKKGLLPMDRLHVHLSATEETASQVANRRKGESVILKIDCIQMCAKDYQFYLSKNGVWLSDFIPPEFIF